MPPTNADYAKINIACKELGLDKYQLISDRYGVESSKQLTRFQCHDLYTHFKNMGWKVKRGDKQKKSSPKYKKAIHRKVVALWITLAQAGAVKNRSDQAMQAYVKRITKKENLAWCDDGDCYMLIESLKAWAHREDIELD